MAIGRSRRVAKYVEDPSKPEGYKFIPSENINISISADHRILDGATVAKFGAKMKTFLENPNLMLINMSWLITDSHNYLLISNLNYQNNHAFQPIGILKW